MSIHRTKYIQWDGKEFSSQEADYDDESKILYLLEYPNKELYGKILDSFIVVEGQEIREFKDIEQDTEPPLCYACGGSGENRTGTGSCYKCGGLGTL